MSLPGNAGTGTDLPWKLGRDHANNIDFLRCFFALLVIYSHSYVLETGGREVDAVVRLTRGQIDGGALALDGFFAISGLLVTHSWLGSRGLMSFLRKRVLRIYPGFLFACLFCVLVGGPLSQPEGLGCLSHVQPRTLLRHAAVLHFELRDLFPNNPFPNSIDGSMWTIPYEFACYLLIAVIGIVGLIRRPVGLVMLFIGVFALHAAWPSDGWCRFICYFLAGAAFCTNRTLIPRSRPMLILSVILLAASALLGRGLELVLPVLGTYALFYFAFAPLKRLSRFGKYGDFSYGLYLYAFPIQQLLVLYDGHHLTPLTLFFAASALTFPLAALSWFLIERPALAGKARLLDGQRRSAGEMVGSLVRQPLLALAAILGLFGAVDYFFVYPIERFAAGRVTSQIWQNAITVALFAVFVPWCTIAAFRVWERDVQWPRLEPWRTRLRRVATIFPVYYVPAAFAAKNSVSIARDLAALLSHRLH